MLLELRGIQRFPIHDVRLVRKYYGKHTKASVREDRRLRHFIYTRLQDTRFGRRTKRRKVLRMVRHFGNIAHGRTGL